MKLILGSSSKFRRQIMDELGVPYEVVSPDIDEKSIRHDDPETLVLAIANAKADAVAAQVHEPAFVIASDQVVVWNGQIREKPKSIEQAREFIQSYGEHPAVITNGMCVLNMETGKRTQGTETMHVWYRAIPDQVAAHLASQENAMLSAGGLRFENPIMQQYMYRTDGGRDISFGLPVKLLKKLLHEQGYEI